MWSQIAGKHTCDRRLSRAALAAEFGRVDHSLLETEEDPYWGDGLTRERFEQVAHRAALFVEWLAKRPERTLAVATHSAWLLSLFNAVLLTEREEDRSWFGTGEMRGVELRFEPKVG